MRWIGDLAARLLRGGFRVCLRGAADDFAGGIPFALRSTERASFLLQRRIQ
jgi:hypothetical protein